MNIWHGRWSHSNAIIHLSLHVSVCLFQCFFHFHNYVHTKQQREIAQQMKEDEMVRKRNKWLENIDSITEAMRIFNKKVEWSILLIRTFTWFHLSLPQCIFAFGFNVQHNLYGPCNDPRNYFLKTIVILQNMIMLRVSLSTALHASNTFGYVNNKIIRCLVLFCYFCALNFVSCQKSIWKMFLLCGHCF